jgi:hypothetical protein
MLMPARATAFFGQGTIAAGAVILHRRHGIARDDVWAVVRGCTPCIKFLPCLAQVVIARLYLPPHGSCNIRACFALLTPSRMPPIIIMLNISTL